jgi:hypothetical protein
MSFLTRMKTLALQWDWHIKERKKCLVVKRRGPRAEQAALCFSGRWSPASPLPEFTFLASARAMLPTGPKTYMQRSSTTWHTHIKISYALRSQTHFFNFASTAFDE